MSVVPENPVWIAASLLQAVISALLAWVIWLTGKRISGGSHAAAWFSMLCFICHPALESYCFQYCSEPLFCLCLVCMVYMFLKRDEGIIYSILAGIFGGLSLWARPTGLILLPIIFVSYFCIEFLYRKNICSVLCNKKMITGSVLFCAAFCLTILPNAVRNKCLFGTFNPTSYLSGFNVLFSNSMENLKAYQCGSGVEFLKWQDKAWDRACTLVREMPSEYCGKPAEQNQYLLNLAGKTVRDGMTVQDYVFLFCAKAWHYIRPWPVTGIHSAGKFALLAVSECVLYLLGLFGLYICWKRKQHDYVLLFFIIVFCSCFAHACVQLNFRYRIPFIDLLLYVPAGFAMSGIWQRFCHGLSHGRLQDSEDRAE